ncbi:MAG: sulfurtransferase [Xenophilus sp.]
MRHRALPTIPAVPDAVLNISAYLFVPLPDRADLRPRLLAQCQAAGLKGSILLAEEGINLFLAGEPQAVRGFIDALREADERFSPLAPKESWSVQQPFRRMLVKLKREIIRMDHPAIRPAAGRAPAVQARTLRRWLDQGHDDAGRPVVMLDTRNAFEVDCGSFEHAIDWRLRKFSEFPAAVQAHRAELEGKTVVSFCTGGIRCEKAAIYMHDIGLPHVLQLEGGILKYFEEVGGAHYRGDCFVFDGREALAPDLSARAPHSSARRAEDPDIAVKAHPLSP